MTKLTRILCVVLSLILLLSCNSGSKQDASFTPTNTKVKFRGYVVPADSLDPPKVVQAGIPRTVKISPPRVVAEKIHFKINAEPARLLKNHMTVCSPGRDGYAKPKTVMATGQSFLVDAPEIVVAKNPSSRDDNQHGFISYGAIQGLKANHIRCLLQDHEGNLWFNSEDGVTRYDGKYLSHFVISNDQHNNSIVLCMMEDKAGILWFGTFGGGLLSFDGKKIIQYTQKEGLSNNIVNAIIQDRSGDYWIATSGGGVSKFDGKAFTHYALKEGLPGDQVRSLCQDRDGSIWMGTFGAGISKFDGVAFHNFSLEGELPVKHVASIIQDAQGNMWFGTNNQGLVKYDGKNFYQYTEKQGLNDRSVLNILQDDDSTLWLGTSGGGIYKYDGKHFFNYTDEDGLPNNFIRSSLKGRQGYLWFGTREGGLVRYDKNMFRHYTDHDGLGNSRIYGMLQDRRGNLWFGAFGGGLSRYDGKEFTTYLLKESVLNDYVYALVENEDGSLWLASDGGGITRFDGTNLVQYMQEQGLCNNAVRCILKDRHQNLWVGSYGGGVSKFDGKSFVNFSTKEGLNADKVLCMLEDRNGVIWFGTDGGGVTRYDGKVFTHFTIHEGLQSNSIASIRQDAKGNLWFGSAGGGLSRYDGEYLEIFTRKNGLSNNYITSLLEDRHGNIWMGTRTGPNVLRRNQLDLNQENQKPLTFQSFSYDDGFLGVGCNLAAILEDKSGNIWIGASNRLTVISPAAEIPDTVSPNIKLTQIRLFDENMPWLRIEASKDTSFVLENGVRVGNFKFSSVSRWYFLPEDLSLAHNNNFLTFNYTGISQKQTLKMKYQYQLEGLDLNWSTPTDQTEISFGNLRPGKYVFKVKGMSTEGVWSKEAKYPFTIRHPWWESWWFYLLIILGVLLLLFSYIKWRELEHEQQRKLLNMKIGEQTRELQEKNNALQMVNSEKDKFFSIIAHDVRGPLGSFMMFTEVMSQNIPGYSKDEMQAMTDAMHKSASGLFELVENLLEWARIQRGLIPYSPEPLTLLTILNESIEAVQHAARNKSIEMTVDMDATISVIADRNMLGSIFRNLTSNAVKFTPNGGKVKIGAQRSDEHQIVVSVADTGIGMDKKMVAELFRTDMNNSRKGTNGEASSGLGLLLCKEFVTKLQGKLWVESETGKGSTFYFSLMSADGQ